MASLTIRKGITHACHAKGISFLGAAIFTILLERFLKAIGDPIGVGDIAEQTGSPTDDVLRALHELSEAGMIASPGTSWGSVNMVGVHSLSLRAEAQHGLIEMSTEKEETSRKNRKKASLKGKADGNRYEGEINPDPTDQTRYILGIWLLDEDGSRLREVEQIGATSSGEAQEAFLEWLRKQVPEFVRGDVIQVAGKGYAVTLRSQDHDGETVVYFEVAAKGESPAFNGTAPDEENAWVQIEAWYRGQPHTEEEAPAKPRRARKSK